MIKISTLSILLFSSVVLSIFFIRSEKNKKNTDIKNSNINNNSIKSNQSLNTKSSHRAFNAENYIGSWCDNRKWKDTGELFSLTIARVTTKQFVAEYHSGGPFQESFKGICSGDSVLFLYFDNVEGSISFNSQQDRNTFAKCKKIKFARCKLIDKNKLEIKTFSNKCSNMPKNTNIILKRLNQGESCE